MNLIEGQDWVLIAERVPEIRKLIANTHVGVICSQGSEVICRVAEEFLLCGAPIYVSGVGSLGECVFDEKMGFVYGDRLGMDAINPLRELLIGSFQEAADAKRARADLAKDRFTFQAMGKGLEKAIAELVPSLTEVNNRSSKSRSFSQSVLAIF